jgi:hypothetical protein
MGSLIAVFLKSFWYLAAAACGLNLMIYSRVFQKTCADPEEASRAFRAYRTMILAAAGFSLLLGALQTAGGFAVPVFPFSSPRSSGSRLVQLSWIVAILEIGAIAIFINSRDRRVAEALTRVFLGNLLQGRMALRVFNITSSVAVVALLVAAVLV